MSKTSLATSNNAKGMSEIGARKLCDQVKSEYELVTKSFLRIAPMVAKLYDCKGYASLGYKNYDEMCTFEFGMSHGTATELRKVFKRFGAVTAKNEYMIPEQYVKWGYTKLLLFCNSAVDFEKANINPLETFTPDMSVKAMRNALKDALIEKGLLQDKGAIDTEGVEVTSEGTEGAEVTSEGAEVTSEGTEGTEGAEVEKVSDKELIQSMIVDVKTLMLTMDYLKPEKRCLLEAIAANLKELKKFAK